MNGENDEVNNQSMTCRRSVQNFLLLILGLSFLGSDSVGAQNLSSGAPVRLRGVEVGVILERLGAKMEDGVSDAQIRQYQGHFDRMDQDRDGRHSKVEFIEEGNYLNLQSRRGIFNAADRDRNGVVTKAEYILNRIITDEGKAIVQAMDDDKNGVVEQAEFLKHATVSLSDGDLAEEVFVAFDSDGNDEISVPEYLRVWGQWARSNGQTATQRLPQVSINEVRSDSQPSSPFPNRRFGQRRGQGGPPNFGGGGFGPFSANSEPVRLNRAGLKVGSILPDISIYDADGKGFEMSRLKGTYSVLVFGCLT
jgi:Ca2+-binding EF-hand superfamily protein